MDCVVNMALAKQNKMSLSKDEVIRRLKDDISLLKAELSELRIKNLKFKGKSTGSQFE